MKYLEVDLPLEDGSFDSLPGSSGIPPTRTVMVPSYHLGGHTITKACEHLADGYILAKRSKDHNFAKSYTSRKFADMTEIFGQGTTWDRYTPEQRGEPDKEPDFIAGTKFVQFLPQYWEADFLTYDLQRSEETQQGSAVKGRLEHAEAILGTVVGANREGFHSKAFGGADSAGLQGLKGLSTLVDFHNTAYKGTTSKLKFDPAKLPDDHLERIRGELDPRAERYAAVQNYLTYCGITADMSPSST